MPKLIDLTLRTFGKWTVKNRGETRNKLVYWWCECECGTLKEVSGGSLRSGASLSCGCVWREVMNNTHTKHGAATRRDKTPEYKVWEGMKKRCYQVNCKSYPNYGGRGIIMSEEWRHSFEAFLRDMGTKPKGTLTIERIDNSKGYNKTNCVWADTPTQNRNTRRTNLVTIDGVTKCLKDWCIELGISYSAVKTRKTRHSMTAESVLAYYASEESRNV